MKNHQNVRNRLENHKSHENLCKSMHGNHENSETSKNPLDNY